MSKVNTQLILIKQINLIIKKISSIVDIFLRMEQDIVDLTLDQCCRKPFYLNF